MPLEIDSMDLAAVPEVTIFQDFQQLTDRFSADKWADHIEPPILNSRDLTIGLEARDYIYNTSVSYPLSIGLEDELLLTLRNERGKTWRDISVSFEDVFGKRYHAPAPQMRYIRLQKRMDLNTDKDMAALFQAHAYWLNVKWQIISEKMAELGHGEQWTPSYLI
ncbi:hypothetical protein AAEP93_005927 [Penicillium crustosum]